MHIMPPFLSPLQFCSIEAKCCASVMLCLVVPFLNRVVASSVRGWHAQVLSVVAQQVLEIQLAVKAKLKSFVFEGSELTLRPSCNVFM